MRPIYMQWKRTKIRTLVLMEWTEQPPLLPTPWIDHNNVIAKQVIYYRKEVYKPNWDYDLSWPGYGPPGYYHMTLWVREGVELPKHQDGIQACGPWPLVPCRPTP